MTKHTLAVDVGGILYYDEPFDLAWLQGVWDRVRTNAPAPIMNGFLHAMRAFYRGRAPGSTPPSLFPPYGTHSWNGVRERWTELVQPIPGAVDALIHLAGQYELCIVANQPPECLAALRDLGIEDRLRLVVLDSLVGYTKPDPQIFRWALERLDWTPEHTVIVGDRVDHDAAPAATLGCPAVIGAVDTGWHAPHGVDPRIQAAYREMRAERRRPAVPIVAHHTITRLDELSIPSNCGVLPMRPAPR